MQTSLLALNLASIAGEEAGLLEGTAVSRIVGVQRTGDRETESAGLARGATTLEVRLDVELAFTLNEGERGLNELLVQLVREVIFQGAAVTGELAGAGGHHDANNGALAAPHGLDREVALLGFNDSFFFNLSGDRIADGGNELFGRCLSGDEVGLVGLVLNLVFGVLAHYCATCLIS